MPRNEFTNTALLYSDKIYTIAPWQTTYLLSMKNRILIREGAIKQIRPEDDAYKYPQFGDCFIKLFDSLEIEQVYPDRGGWAATADVRRTASRIHTHKLLTSDLYGMLVERNLALPSGPW